MAGYASVISLNHAIHRLLKSSQILLLPLSTEILKSVTNELQSFRKTLYRLDRVSKSSSRNKINALDEHIRELVCNLEDVLESHIKNQILSQSDEDIRGSGVQFTIDLQETEHEIICLVESLKEMEHNYIKELENPEFADDDAEEEEDEIVVPSRIDFGGSESKMVGLSDIFMEIKNKVQRFDGHHGVTPITGMAGIGKTTLAKEILNDSDIIEQFDFRVWVTVGRKWNLREILLAILAQVDADMYDMIMNEEVKKISDYLNEKLKGKRDLIVLDDVWDNQVWKDLNSLFAEDENGRKILITTRLDQVGRNASNNIAKIVKLRLLNNDESWALLREKVFGEELCSYELEKIGRKIAGECEGLPLMIVAVANLLSQEER